MREPWCAWLVVVGLVKLSPVDSCINFQADTLGGKSMYAGKLSAANRRDWEDAFEDLGVDRHCEYSPKSQATFLCCTGRGCARHLVEALSSILLATTLLSLWVAFHSWILQVLRHCRARQMKVALIRCLTMSVKKMMSKWTKQGSMLAYRALWLLEVLALATQPHACPAA